MYFGERFWGPNAISGWGQCKGYIFQLCRFCVDTSSGHPQGARDCPYDPSMERGSDA